MAAAVADTLDDGGVLLAEAGTGTGKTLAYLVPAILYRQRILVSTGTKNLQEQIYFKDIPALRHALGVPFTATYMKGRANYLCLHRLDQLRAHPAAPMDFISDIDEWRRATETGDRAELTGVAARGDSCPQLDRQLLLWRSNLCLKQGRSQDKAKCEPCFGSTGVDTHFGTSSTDRP